MPLALNIIGATTPRAFFAALLQESLYDGFINRFLFFPSTRINIDETIFENKPPPLLTKSILEGLRRMYFLTADSKMKIDDEPCKPFIVSWRDDVAKNTYASFFCHLQNLNPDEKDMFSSVVNKLLRVV